MNLKKIKDNAELGAVSGGLLGYIPRLKEIHYSAANMDIHNLADEVIGAIRGFEDKLLELLQGDTGERVKQGEIQVGTLDPNLSLADILSGVMTFAGQYVSIYPDLVHSFTEDIKQKHYLLNVIEGKVTDSAVLETFRARHVADDMSTNVSLKAPQPFTNNAVGSPKSMPKQPKGDPKGMSSYQASKQPAISGDPNRGSAYTKSQVPQPFVSGSKSMPSATQVKVAKTSTDQEVKATVAKPSKVTPSKKQASYKAPDVPGAPALPKTSSPKVQAPAVTGVNLPKAPAPIPDVPKQPKANVGGGQDFKFGQVGATEPNPVQMTVPTPDPMPESQPEIDKPAIQPTVVVTPDEPEVQCMLSSQLPAILNGTDEPLNVYSDEMGTESGSICFPDEYASLAQQVLSLLANGDCVIEVASDSARSFRITTDLSKVCDGLDSAVEPGSVANHLGASDDDSIAVYDPEDDSTYEEFMMDEGEQMGKYMDSCLVDSDKVRVQCTNGRSAYVYRDGTIE